MRDTAETVLRKFGFHTYATEISGLTAENVRLQERIRSHEAEFAALCREYAELDDRCDRLRKSLERVASHRAGGCDAAMLAVAEARAALQDDK